MAEEKPRRRGMWERTAAAMGLPLDALAGLPLVELTGDVRLRVENHRGILSYSPTEIHIGGGRVAFRVRGSELEIKVMNRRELVIEGQVLGVELE